MLHPTLRITDEITISKRMMIAIVDELQHSTLISPGELEGYLSATFPPKTPEFSICIGAALQLCPITLKTKLDNLSDLLNALDPHFELTGARLMLTIVTFLKKYEDLTSNLGTLVNDGVWFYHTEPDGSMEVVNQPTLKKAAWVVGEPEKGFLEKWKVLDRESRQALDFEFLRHKHFRVMDDKVELIHFPLPTVDNILDYV